MHYRALKVVGYLSLPCLALVSCVASDVAQASCAEGRLRTQMTPPHAIAAGRSRLDARDSHVPDTAELQDAHDSDAEASLVTERLGSPHFEPTTPSTLIAQAPIAQTNQAPPGKSPPSGQPSAQTSTAQPPAQGPTAGQPAEEPAAPASNSPAQPAAPAPKAGQTSQGGVAASGAAGGGSAENNAFFIVTSDIIGLKVRESTDSGQYVGRLGSLVIDGSTGQALYAVIDRGGFLGFDQTQVIVPFQLLDFPGQWGFPILKVSASKLDDAPRFSDQGVEALLHDPDWRRSVADYFSVELATERAKPPQASIPAATASGTAAGPAITAAAANIPADHGETIAHTVCAVCHTFNKGGGVLVGPNLYGVAGRPIASVAGYNYSPALKEHHGNWDPANLNTWLENPSAYSPGTFMTFAGIKSERDRQDVIAYLETLKDQAKAAH